MVLPSPTTLAVGASLVVAVVALAMVYLGWRSYRVTQNVRLVFVVMALGVFVLKSLFTGYNVHTHAVPHDTIELIGAMFDLFIVFLLFTPFVVPKAR